MLVANSISVGRGEQQRQVDIRKLFNNDMRGMEAPLGIQNIAEVGLKEFGVYPGQWYGINQMSRVMEILVRQFRPVENFQICTF